jgi:hypothetical protein
MWILIREFQHRLAVRVDGDTYVFEAGGDYPIKKIPIPGVGTGMGQLPLEEDPEVGRCHVWSSGPASQ